MKILHGSIRTTVSVRVEMADASPPSEAGDPEREIVEGHGYYERHGDATFSVDPDGTLYLYGDPSKPAHHSYGRDAWLWVGDENNNSAFNTVRG